MPSKNSAYSVAEAPKRLQPTYEALRELFLKSGNLCAFPDCNRLMMDQKGVFIGQVCHIEAAEPGGPRFNPDQTNEDRRAFENLVLMCYEHHKVTDDEQTYPVVKLVEIKRFHEGKYSDPGRVMLAELGDWTTLHEPSLPQTLQAANDELGWGLSPSELTETVAHFTDFASRLKNVPLASRRVFGLLSDRAYRLKQEMTPSRRHRFNLLLKDAQSALGLPDRQFRDHLQILEHHRLAAPDKDDDGNTIISFYNKDYRYILDDIVAFAQKRGMPIDTFFIEMRFDLLDRPAATA
jgi:hypothetical protein